MENWLAALSSSWMLGGCAHTPPEPPEPPPVERTLEQEIWTGQVAITEEISFDFSVVFSPRADGGAAAALNIPAQGLYMRPLQDVEHSAQRLRFTLARQDAPAAHWAHFEADRAEDRAEGALQQAGQRFALTMERSGDVASADLLPPRPQNPTEPFPYQVETVSYEGADVRISGSLTLPGEEGPHPAVVLVAGAGALDRDATRYHHKPFWVLADHLTRRGVAVLRVDARGVGGSTGDAALATLDQRALDTGAALQLLAAHPRIDARRLGLIGHSEGGLVALHAASGRPDLAFLVLLSTPALPGDQIVLHQLERELRHLTPDERALRLQLQRALLDTLAAPRDSRQELQRRIAPLLSDAHNATALARQVELQLELLASPWHRSLIRFDPRPHLADLQTPLLVLIGEEDTQVLPRENLAAFHQALDPHRGVATDLRSPPHLNHLLQTVTSDNPRAYLSNPETLSPHALELISAWIVEQIPSATVH